MIRIQADGEGNLHTSNPEQPQSRENTSAPTPEPVVKFGGIRSRYDSSTGKVTVLSDGNDPRIRGYNTATDKPGADPLDNARSQQGSPVARMSLGLDDIVDYGGTTRVRELVSMGVLVRDANGYRWADGKAPAGVTAPLVKQEAEAVAAEAGENEPISAAGIPGTSAAADVFLGSTRQAVGDTVYTGTLTAVIQGHDLSPFVQEISRRTQQPEDQIRDGIETARGEFERAGRAIAMRAGVGNLAYTDFVEWAQERHPDQALEAGLALAQHKDVTGFTKLARQYARTGRGDTAGITDADLLGARFGNGIKARQTSDGVVLDIPNQGTMSFKQAVASGLVKVSRN